MAPGRIWSSAAAWWPSSAAGAGRICRSISAAPASEPLLLLDLRLLDDVVPHRHFLGDARGQALRPGGADVEANVAQLGGDLGLLQHRQRLGRDALHDRV